MRQSYRKIAHADRVPGSIEFMQLLTLLLSLHQGKRPHPRHWTSYNVEDNMRHAKALRGYPSIRST